MAEALGLASGVIAVVDMTVKAGSTYVKLIRLWDEVKQVPETLRTQTEEIRDLEDYLLDIDAGFATSPLPEFAPSRALMERHITKCKLALEELKNAVDDVYTQITKARGFRSKIAATKAVLRKDDHNTLTSKLDRALKLFQLAQAQERRWMWVDTVVLSSELRCSPLRSAIATFTAIVDANSRERLPGAFFGTPKKLPENEPTAILPRFQAGSGWPSVVGKVSLGRGSKGSFQLSYQAPTWLTRSVYSLLAEREIRGWQVSLRAYEVVKTFNGQLGHLVSKDDATSVSRYLTEHKMTPFSQDPDGNNLLMLALAYNAYEVTKFLLRYNFEEYAAGIFCRSSIAYLFLLLHACHYNFQVLGLLEDIGLSDFIDTLTSDDLGVAFVIGISPPNYQALLDRSGHQNEWLSISDRLTGALNVLSAAMHRWRFRDLCFLLPEIKSPEGPSKVFELSMGVESGSLLHTLAIGMVSISSKMLDCDLTVEDEDKVGCAEDEKTWARTLVACIKAAPKTLHHLELFYLYTTKTSVTCTPLAAIISHVVDQMYTLKWGWRFLTPKLLIGIRASFRLWIETVASAGADLLSYGREEKRLQESGRSTILQKLCSRRRQYGERPYKIYSRSSIVGITYGGLPSQWQLWTVDNDYEYTAGEFWEMVEAQEFSVPGEWVDPVDEWEETEQWLVETPPPLIWSEYRKIRPPI